MGLALLVLAVLFFMFGDIKSSHIDSDISATSHLRVTKLLTAIGYWMLLAIIFTVLKVSSFLPAALTLLLFIFVASTSTLANITAALAMVQLSYRLGCMSLVKFKRNPHAAGLYFGFLAVHKIKDPEQKKQHLHWLREQFINHDSAIYSGDIVLYRLIESQLNHPDNFDELATQLNKLSGLGTRSIPKAISRYAFKCAIVAPLADADWDELYSIACQWDGKAKNRLARYVKYFYWVQIKQQRGFSKLKYFYYRLFCLTEPVLRTLPARYKQATHSDKNLNTSTETDQCSSLSTLMNTNSLSEQQSEQISASLLSEQQQQHWLQRAEQLGSWNSQASWQSICQSVQTQLALKAPQAQKNQEHSDEHYEQIDRNYKNLLYLSRSINKQVEEKSMKGGVRSFLEFQKVLQLLDQLAADRQAYFTAIHNIDNILWNWIVLLWNRKKDQSLVHFMCMNCIPLAEQTGNQRFLAVIDEIICD